MSDPVLTLEYEMTLEDVQADFKHVHRRGRKARWILAGFMLNPVSFAISAGEFRWTAAALGTLGILVLVGPYLLSRWMPGHLARTRLPAAAKLEIEERSLLHQVDAWKQLERFWWSRLSDCIEEDGGFDLSFDNETGPHLYIPGHAFADDQQRTLFRSLVDEHLSKLAINQPT